MTAVEFLKEKFTSIFINDDGFNKLFEQAKEMEKQQIIDAFDEGQEYEYQYHINGSPKFDSETYFAETYGETLKDNHIVDTTEMVEISDEEIEKEAYRYDENKVVSDYRNSSTYGDFIEGAKWYREQLKSRQ